MWYLNIKQKFCFLFQCTESHRSSKQNVKQTTLSGKYDNIKHPGTIQVFLRYVKGIEGKL